MAKKPDELLPTRRTLLERLKHWDDSQSWQEFFDLYWKLIYGVAVKAGLSDAEAQDVVQETVIAVARNIGEFEYDPSRSFKAWLLNITRWRITDQFRKRLPVARPKTTPPDDSTRTDPVDKVIDTKTAEVDRLWDKEYEEHLLGVARKRVMQEANARHYQIYDLHVVKGWPVEKVARLMSVTEALVYQVKSRTERALAKEIKRLQTKGV
jgi:RNA polymerase sigma factor (sigma-70 family)